MGDVHNRGTKSRPSWYCRYIDIDGKRKHRPTHQPTKALALRYVAEVEARVARGLSGIPERTAPEQQGRTLTLMALTQRFCSEAKPPTKNPARYRSWLHYTMGKHVLPVFGGLPIARLSSEMLEAFRDHKLADGYKPATVNSMLKAVSVLYIWARKQGLHAGVNPTSGLRQPTPMGLMDYLNGIEVSQLLEYTQEHAPTVHPMIATAIYTGMRKGELLGLRWSDILFDQGVIHVAHSYGKTPKSGRWRPVPLHPMLRPILRDWQERCPADPLVFPVVSPRGSKLRMGTPDDMMGLAALLHAAGCHVPIRPWHALRHTFASHYVMAGGNLLALQRILGHSKFEMTQIYSHLAPDYLAGEIARLSFLPYTKERPTKPS